MRSLQLVLFGIAVAAFLAALFFIGADEGDTLWRLGVAALLLVLVCIKLWPTSPRHN